MTDTRKKNIQWTLRTNSDGTTSWDAVKVAVLMDIRDELQELNGRFRCYTFLQIPHVLSRIDRRLERAGFLLVKRRRKKKP